MPYGNNLAYAIFFLSIFRHGRLVVVGYTPRGSVRHIFSMRKANDREQARLAPYFGL